MHFYGLSYNEVMELDSSMFGSLYEASHMLEAQKMLIDLQVADYPHLKKRGRDKIWKRAAKQAYPAEEKKEGYVSMEEAVKILQGGLNGGR